VSHPYGLEIDNKKHSAKGRLKACTYHIAVSEYLDRHPEAVPYFESGDVSYEDILRAALARLRRR
jgi:hypothetical protein